MTDRTDELRLALVLNGGVSLAVWMGGVVFELNRLVRETHPVYRGLLELTGTAARIDVISGTSAGGVNGAALALALLHDRGLYSLRNVWLETAGLEKLLHDPDTPDLSSLLQGDDVFLEGIEAAFEDLIDDKPALPKEVPFSLSLTSTLFDGIAHKGADDFGAEIEDTVHRAVWRFAHLEGENDFADRQIVRQLAFAARSTASFPIAFEPAAFEAEGTLFKDARRLRVRTSPASALAQDALLLDGGILDNKPFDAALEAIAALPAEGNTRRVLAYVVPDPAAEAERRDRTGDRKPEPPTLAQIAWKSLVSIPASQSIAGHMNDLRQHNDGLAARWRRIVGAVVHMGPEVLLPCASASLLAYRARRIDGMIDYFLEETERQLTAGDEPATPTVARAAAPARDTGAAPGSKPTVMRRATRQWLASTWRLTANGMSSDAGTTWEAWVGDSVEGMDRLRKVVPQWESRLPSSFDPRQNLLDGRWSWGLYALQFVAEFTTEVLRRTQRLLALVPRWQQDEREAVSGPSSAWARVGAGRADDLELDRGRSPAREQTRRSGSRLGDSPLKSGWRDAYALAGRVRQGRRDADRSVRDIGRDGFVAFVAAWSSRRGNEPPIVEALALLERLLSVGAETDEANDDIARKLFGVLLGLRGKMAEILEAHGRRVGRSDIDEAVAELRSLYRYLFVPIAEQDERLDMPGDDPESQLNRLAWRVLALEVFEVTAGSRRGLQGAQAEIVQISARLQSAFGGSGNPAAKLAGMQLAHFGAFYKRSWRANDWTFGCLDGIDRAVRIALNPEALQKRYGNRRVAAEAWGSTVRDEPVAASAYVEHYLKDLAVEGAPAAIAGYLRGLWNAERDDIRAELAWLDRPATVPPPVLEHCARALTRRLQMETLLRELPEIATSLLVERATGAPPSREFGEALLARIAPAGVPLTPSPQDAADLVKRNLLGSETFDDQAGSDQLTRVASQGLATAHAALSSRRSGLGVLKGVLKVTEWPLRLLYWMATRLDRTGKTSAALETLVWGVGLTIVVAALLSPKVSSAVLGFGWALLAAAAGLALLRSPRWTAALFVAVATVLMVAFKLPWVAFVSALGGFAVTVLILRSPAGSAFAALVAIGIAAWWSADGSVDSAAALWQLHSPLAASAPAPTASAAAAAARLGAALGPALAIGVFLIAVALLRWGERSGKSKRR